ncbi:nuclear factor related to kappa-B-binding protein isoform X1 [Phthorimaea operculella]|nr:nuclear factor related to kappa-B-binding protein isoform X1 [Phthorimaea operculella]
MNRSGGAGAALDRISEGACPPREEQRSHPPRRSPPPHQSQGQAGDVNSRSPLTNGRGDDLHHGSRCRIGKERHGNMAKDTHPSLRPQDLPEGDTVLYGSVLSEVLQRFWESEEPPTADRRKPEDDECELFYQYNTARCPSGRFVTRLPFLPNRPALDTPRRGWCARPRAPRLQSSGLRRGSVSQPQPNRTLTYNTENRAKPAPRPQESVRYRSVVGPCARVSMTCAGNAALLVAERPRHASFLALVRDAVARLPNGEGTRHDVVTLIKMSQWLAPCTDQALLSAVSTALDRMHSAKRDPFVKFDQRTAVWTYLHRHRSEEDWIKSASSRSRAAKNAAAPPPPPPAPAPALPAPPPPPARHMHHTPPHSMEMEVASVEEVVDNGSDTDVDVDDSSSPSTAPHITSAQLLMQATQSQAKLPQKPKGKLIAVSPPKPKPLLKTQPKTSTPKPNLPPPIPKTAKLQKPLPTPKPLPIPTKPVSKQATLMAQAAKQASLMAQSAKQASVIAQLTKPVKQNSVPKQVVVKPPASSPKQAKPPVKQPATQPVTLTETTPVQSVVKPSTSVVQSAVMTPSAPQKSPLIKQRPLQKQTEPTATISAASILTPQAIQVSTPVPTPSVVPTLTQNKLVAGTRSLLLRAPVAPPAPVPAAATAHSTAQATTTTSQTTPSQKRGIVRVLSPATPSAGKSLISPRALLQPGTAATKKRATGQETTAVTTIAQSTSATTVVSSVPTAVSTALPTRTVQLAGGRTVQLSANQTVHLPGGQAVQLSSGHTLQLSSLQLPTHSVRLPSGQTVQLASPQAIRVSQSQVKTSSPRPQTSNPTVKTAQSTVQIPISSVQLGQTVQIAGQTVQLGGQSVQLTGHTVKLPSGQSVQVASQSVLPSNVQLPSGQTVQLGANMQTVQLGQNVINQPQTVQLSGQTVQLPSGQTLQLAGGQTIQLASGQTIQLASGQVQLANQQKVAAQRQQTTDKLQPIVAKLLTNSQGQMISLEGGAGARALQMSGMRVLSPARMPRPLLLTAAKPLHHNNIQILQQGDGSAIRMTSTGGTATSQTIVLSNIGAQSVTTSTTSAPLLKLQQVNTLQQVKLAQGLKLQQGIPSSAATSSAGTMRGVVMDAHQLKLVGGRHVLARILRPAHPPQPPPQ